MQWTSWPIGLVSCAIAVLSGCGGGQAATQVSTPAPSQLCVVRHAEAFKNLEPRPADLSANELDTLTPTGEAQARELGDTLPSPAALVWASPAHRARQTAELLGLDPPVEVVTDLRSLDGDISWDERLRSWSEQRDPRPEGGESLADGQARARSLLARLRAAVAPGGHAVVVTHGDMAAILVGELRGTPLLERPTTDAPGLGEAICWPLSADAGEPVP